MSCKGIGLVYCSSCGVAIVSGSRFCRQCGAALSTHDGNNVNIGGGDIHGGLYQAGRDVFVNLQDTASPLALYDPVPKWRSPATQGFLGWAEFIIGLLGLFPIWKLSGPIRSHFPWVDNIFKGLGISSAVPADETSYDHLFPWIIAVIFLGWLFLVSRKFYKMAKLQLRKPLVFGWAVSGVGRRINLEKIKAGKCPRCGGAMRYYNNRKEWIDYPIAFGFKWRKVTKREATLECKRNRDHCYRVDSAESLG